MADKNDFMPADKWEIFLQGDSKGNFTLGGISALR